MRVVTGIIVGVALGPVGYGLNIWAAAAIGAGVTMGLGVATGASWKQILFEGAMTFIAVACISNKIAEWKTSTGGGGGGLLGGLLDQLKYQRDQDAKNADPENAKQNLDEHVKNSSDRAGHGSPVGNTEAGAGGGNGGNGAGSSAWEETWGFDRSYPAETLIVGDISPKITWDELTGKTPSEIRQMANDKGLKPFGDASSPDYPRKWKDPVTNQKRLRIDQGHYDKYGKPYDIVPEAGKPHVHGYDEYGKSIRSTSGNKHFPLASEVGSFAGVVSRIFGGLALLLYPQEAY